VDNSLRYFACAVGFGFGVLWMTEGLGAAILCALLAGLGYGAVFVAERARANPSAFRLTIPTTPEHQDLSVAAEEIGQDHGYVYEPSEDASSPLAAEAEYGWPVERPEVVHSNGRAD
jgi:hypothetical protein